ncbi:MAG TPA: LLM class flavin-dependent oxidoreductase [Pyrinomonadaceae bacterium]|nr:LLM class flavin-dependent oxidoreductase [Pyrinomonadaceae bacterium]
MTDLTKIQVSVLDLAPIGEGFEAADALRNSLDLARKAERLGYKRFWVAEHHSMPGIASAATAVVIGHIAGGTSTIRVGAGGIMLPNHAPYVIAEQFGTLEALYGKRIDLGLGRAPGSDRATAHALRRSLESGGDDFPELLAELRFFLKAPTPGQKVTAIPGAGSNVPIWLLGSSGFSAQLAGQLGLPFSFAAHFSPEYTLPALELYRRNFRPSETLGKPYAMVALNVFAADTDAEAQRLATSQHQSFLNLIRGKPGKIQPPVDDMDLIWTPQEKAMVDARLGGSIIGDSKTVRRGIEEFVQRTAADELMVNAIIYDHDARLRSYEIVAEVTRLAASAAFH